MSIELNSRWVKKLYKKYFYYTIDNLRMADKEGKVIKTRLCFDESSTRTAKPICNETYQLRKLRFTLFHISFIGFHKKKCLRVLVFGFYKFSDNLSCLSFLLSSVIKNCL